MNKNNLEKINKLKDLILASNKTMVLTGAGISTDSGIPDFRSEGTGLWGKIDPMKYLTKKILIEEPEKFYKKFYGELKINKKARPNKGHEILAELEERGFIDGLITQNIDSLHREAGSKRVYEVHGNINDGYCLECGQYIKGNEIREKVESKELPPRCNYCKGVVRTSVVLFGDSLTDEFDYVKKEVKKSELLIVIGSSLKVSPVNSLVKLARKTVIINNEKTIMDDLVELVIIEDASLALEELIKML